MSRLRGVEQGRDRYEVAVGEVGALAEVRTAVLEKAVAGGAMCAGADTERWFPPVSDGWSWGDSAHAAERQLAAGLCSGCPVISECLALSFALGSRGRGAAAGVWGGLGTRDRARLRVVWLREGAPRHGFRSRAAS
jgi:WhiB family redox-sensing transcriptional regulator